MFTFEGEFSKMDDKKDMYIFGPASMEVLDLQGDIITIDAIRKALPQLLRRARLTVDHSDNIVGEILENAEVRSKAYRTEVRFPSPDELSKFKNLIEGREALFVLAKVWSDTEYCMKIRNAIARGQYKKYSIAGNVLEARPCTREEYCGRLVSDINLSAVTICNAGANPAAEFDIIKRGNQMTEEIPVEKVEEIYRISQDTTSLSTPVGDDEDSFLGDFIEDTTQMSPYEETSKELLRESIKEVLGSLDERETRVLSLRFGLMGETPKTLEEVGKIFNVTRERIRQIEAKALRKLRHPSRRKKLQDYLE